MIIITEVKTIEVEEDWHAFYRHCHDPNPRYPLTGKGGMPTHIEDVVQEIVCNQKIMFNGKDCSIGMTVEVYRVLGLPLEAIETQKKEIEDLDKSLESTWGIVRKHMNASLWQRIKWVFTGIKV